ncbi:MAG: MoaD/ThiS family protein [Bacteroidales bacterium]|nr:MAG: MoaD/ThiS family protein [Bacteroidales bacterium]
MKIEVLFFGVLTEVSKVDKLVIHDVKNLEGLMNELNIRYPDLQKYTFQISVNREIIHKNKSFKDGDEVAFLPPFAGG